MYFEFVLIQVSGLKGRTAHERETIITKTSTAMDQIVILNIQITPEFTIVALLIHLKGSLVHLASKKLLKQNINW